MVLTKTVMKVTMNERGLHLFEFNSGSCSVLGVAGVAWSLKVGCLWWNERRLVPKIQHALPGAILPPAVSDSFSSSLVFKMKVRGEVTNIKIYRFFEPFQCRNTDYNIYSKAQPYCFPSISCISFLVLSVSVLSNRELCFNMATSTTQGWDILSYFRYLLVLHHWNFWHRVLL